MTRTRTIRATITGDMPKATRAERFLARLITPLAKPIAAEIVRQQAAAAEMRGLGNVQRQMAEVAERQLAAYLSNGVRGPLSRY